LIHEDAGARLNGVDVMRGLCVLLVTLHHIHLRFWLNDYDVDHYLPKLSNRVLFWSGYYAVICFFVISGFLITGLSLRRWGRLGSVHLGRFYAMRAARILPCLMLLLLVSSALDLAGSPAFTINPARASLTQALWAALGFHVNWLEGHHGYLPGTWDVLWSLSVEEAFYIVFPLACLILRRGRMLLLAAACLVIVGPISRTLLAEQEPWGQYAYLSCMDGIALGCLTAFVCARFDFPRRLLGVALALGAAISVIVLVTCSEDSHTGLARYGFNVTLLEAGVALMLLAFGGGVGHRAWARGTAWVRSIGRSSYEIYLVHMFVVLSLMQLFQRIAPPLWTTPVWYCSMLVLSLLSGHALSRYYSEPLNRALRSLGERQTMRPHE
jgi:peptidoglycan/LPS O-acetylase OafA/YrhL